LGQKHAREQERLNGLHQAKLPFEFVDVPEHPGFEFMQALVDSRILPRKPRIQNMIQVILGHQCIQIVDYRLGHEIRGRLRQFLRSTGIE